MWTALWPIVIVLAEFAVKIVMIGFILLRRPRKPSVNLAWVMLILLLPVVGVGAYVLFGEVRLGRRRVRQYEQIAGRLETVRMSNAIAERAAVVADVPEKYRQIATLAEAVGENRAHSANHLVLQDGTEPFMSALLADIAAAQDHCHVLMYIFLPDANGRRLAEALSAAQARGVVCRLLVDSFGSRALLHSGLARELRAAGVQVVEALPTGPFRSLLNRLDLRNHRKIVVIDNTIAYTGSQNIAEASFAPKRRYAPWVDMMVRVEGPVTRDLQAIFVQDWYMDTGEALDALLRRPLTLHQPGAAAQVVATGPISYNDAMRQLIQSALHVAREELILTTPYFVPDDTTAMALETTARRGVETTLIVPRRNDSRLVAAASRSFYEPLLAAGVRILEFGPGLLHAKTMTIDRDLGIVFTANLDRRSFEINFEVSLIVYDSDFASELRRLQRHYADESEPVDLRRWRHRPWPQKLWQNAAGTLSPLL